MLVRFKKGKRSACYDSNALATCNEPTSERPCGPFRSCSNCPYASHGFICYTTEGKCLKTDMQKLDQKRKAGKNESESQ